MQLAKIDGNIVMSHAHSSVSGNALLVCQPIDENGVEAGEPIVAISPFGGGAGSRVLVLADGSVAAEYVGDSHTPIRNSIVCILDD